MKTSIATVSISGDLNEKLKAIAEAGFDGVEIFENDFLAYDASPAEVGRMVRDHGLEITLFQPFRDFEGLPEPQRSRALDRAERKFDLMGEMGAELMLVCSTVSPLALGGIDRAAEDLRELGERASRRGLRVGYEALAWGRYVNDHRDAWEIVRRAGHPALGLILDSFHTLARGIDPDTIRAIPGDLIFIVQLADAPKLSMDPLPWSRHYRNMPGEGELDVVGFMRAVAATGYAGPLSLEIFNDQFRGGSAPTIARDGHRSLIHLMDRVARVEPGIRIEVPTMPDRARPTGVGFVEFSTTEDDARELTALLTSMGFTRQGRHRSKPVDRWQQGGINILLNTGREGLAWSSYVLRGTSAYALALSVDDAQAAQARAIALGSAPIEPHPGPDELAIPGVQGLGGSVIYFLDEGSELAGIWERDFTSDPAAAPADAGLTRIDHVAQTMAQDELLSGVLYYCSTLAMAKLPQVDVVDPAGLVRSQVVESAGGELRLTLNGAGNRQTLAGRFVAEGLGTGIQHLAFATDDIFATHARLAALGFESLPISRNYYDDVEARFGLDPDLADRLRAANLLYDRDEGGEYFQLYSRPMGEGFFFEIVERRGGYGGYGAANALFRIAAQRRFLRPAGMPRI